MSVAEPLQTIEIIEPAIRAPSLETIGMTKIFGSLVALEDVSIKVEAGTVHALLGENGAGKSTLVKCIMGYYTADRGQVLLDGVEVPIRNPRDARAYGIGMVYQHFTLVPSLTGAENLVISRADAPAIIDWKKEMAALNAFLDRMPFRVPLDVPVAAMAAGEKQKLEILKLLYLDQRLLILDEPTSVLTPGEADEMLGLLRDMTHRKEITVIMITHKFREVTSFCDSVTVLRRGRKVGGGEVKDLTTDAMARMMIGDTQIRERAVRAPNPPGETVLELVALCANDDEGLPALDRVNLKVHAGEIVGIAGVSGNGQSELMEVLSGQRPLTDGRIMIKGHPFEPDRDFFLSPEGFRFARGATQERHRAENDGGGEHGVPHLRPAAGSEARLVAIPRTDAGKSPRAYCPIPGEDPLPRNGPCRSVGRQCATRCPGARTLRRC